jgi:hypothetical protein
MLCRRRGFVQCEKVSVSLLTTSKVSSDQIQQAKLITVTLVVHLGYYATSYQPA